MCESTYDAGAVRLIHAERQRQVEGEGWTYEHDDEHDRFQLIDAAVAYAEASKVDIAFNDIEPPHNWPWDAAWWKPSDDPIRNLVKAGALIAAEIDRLLRATGVNDG